MSETTKRIEEIIGETNFEIQTGEGVIEELATHLHQEVIRGKIEELERIKCGDTALSNKNLYNDITIRIADLQRQIKENNNA